MMFSVQDDSWTWGCPKSSKKPSLWIMMSSRGRSGMSISSSGGHGTFLVVAFLFFSEVEHHSSSVSSNRLADLAAPTPILSYSSCANCWSPRMRLSFSVLLIPGMLSSSPSLALTTGADSTSSSESLEEDSLANPEEGEEEDEEEDDGNGEERCFGEGMSTRRSKGVGGETEAPDDPADPDVGVRVLAGDPSTGWGFFRVGFKPVGRGGGESDIDCARKKEEENLEKWKLRLFSQFFFSPT